jgi:hypothetical protein
MGMNRPRFSLRRLLVATTCFSISAALLAYDGPRGGHGLSYSWVLQKFAGLVFVVVGMTVTVGRAAVYVAVALLLIYAALLRIYIMTDSRRRWFRGPVVRT